MSSGLRQFVSLDLLTQGTMTSTVNLSPIASEAMNRVAQAAGRVERLEPRLAAARAELHAAIREAHAEGVGVAVIAKLAGLSRQRVSQIVATDGT
jgi:hypothetical protein